MSFIPDNTVDLIVTSPPYNAGIKYDKHNDNLSESQYEDLLFKVLLSSYMVLKNGGRIAINIAGVNRKPYIFRPSQIQVIIDQINYHIAEYNPQNPTLNNRGVIIWNKSASVGPSTAWGSFKSPSNPVLRDVHEFILIYSKGDYKLQHKGESDLTNEEFVQWTKSIWEIPTASAKKAKFPAPFPEELVKRLVKLYTYKEDIVLDPFSGSGTTSVVSKKLGRNYIGIDISEQYCKLAEENLKAVI